jgi:hypothetical protein
LLVDRSRDLNVELDGVVERRAVPATESKVLE